MTEPVLTAEQKSRAWGRFMNRLRKTDGADLRRNASAGIGKLQRLSAAPPGALLGAWGDLRTMISLLRDYAGGRYRRLPWASVAAVSAAVAYFVSPIDAIADLIPGLGYVDDAFVIGLALDLVRQDMEDYRFWRRNRETGSSPDAAESELLASS